MPLLAADLDQVTAAFKTLLRLADGGATSASDPD